MDSRPFGGGRIMTSWAERMQKRAVNLGTSFTACTHPTPYPLRIERVKFGVPLEEVFKNDIPGPLLVLILKLNKEAPYKKDVFRAPGHQGNVKKLIHFLQNGRLVNIDNFSVYTIASVLKKFLRKVPDGIFGRDGENQLFEMIEMGNIEEQREHIHSLISSLPLSTQRLIVLLFGTFRVIASNSERSETGMTSEALGVSVAPSFFQSCVSDGKTAKMEDVLRYKAEIDVATKIMKFLIDNFGVSNLFGRDNYEYYARITGRILKVEEDWIFSFRYPPDGLVSRLMSFEAEKTWLQVESERWGLKFNLAAMSGGEESQSTPELMKCSGEVLEEAEESEPSSSLTMIHPENNMLESYTRLSISLEDNGLFKDTIDDDDGCSRSSSSCHMTLDELRAVNHYAESTKSLTFLPQVHERQAARMKTRSEWFLSPSPSSKATDSSFFILREEPPPNRPGPGSLFSSSAESLKQLVRRSSSKEKDRRLVRRTSSKKNKENGKVKNANASCSTGPGLPIEGQGDAELRPLVLPPHTHTGPDPPSDSGDQEHIPQVYERDCTETDVQTFHVTLTYKPRI